MQFKATDMDRMLAGTNPFLKFVKTREHKSSVWVIFSFEGKYYGAIRQGNPSNYWEIDSDGLVACVELFRAIRTLLEYVTVDELYSSNNRLTPLDYPFFNAKHWEK
jgi:hypothetical protein